MKLSKSSNRGGRRENAGRKAIWKNPDTMTIRVPKIIATQIIELAHRLDSGEKIDLVSKSISEKNELVTESNSAQNEKITNSEQQSDSDALGDICPKGDRQVLLPSDGNFESITKSNQEDKSEFETITNLHTANSESFENVIKSNSPGIENITKSNKSLNEAIELARKTLKHKKSARHTVAKLISKLYSTSVSFEDLK